MEFTRVEISRSALEANLRQFRAIAPHSLLAPVVKANAYGHGLIQVSRVMEEAGADWLCVNSVYEAVALRREGIRLPLYVLGYVAPAEFDAVAELGLRAVVYDSETVRGLSAAGQRRGVRVLLHLKVETGNNRQGLPPGDAVELARLAHGLPGVEVEGVSSHYADIEDTTDHTFALSQLARFNEACEGMRQAGLAPKVRNFSNSAATILWPQTHFDLVRIGISLYGMWPSSHTFISAVMLKRHEFALTPAMTFKTVVAQVKPVPAGEFVGYGRSFRTTHAIRLAVLPVGYYDGYDRGMSNHGFVLINGQIAPVRGRVCMNMTMVDVSDVRDVHAGSDVVLLGRQGEHAVTAEAIADWTHTINYEVTTRINERIPRVLV
jgi:alanine racemase